MLTIYHRTKKEHELKILEKPLPGTWLYAENPTTEELDVMEEAGFDRDLLDDALDYYEVPRFEVSDGAAYFYTRFPYEEEGETLTSPVLLALNDNHLATLELIPAPFTDKFQKQQVSFYTTQKTKMFLLLIAEINGIYAQYLNTIRKKVRQNRVQLRRIRGRDIVQLVQFESTLNDFLSALQSTNTALRTLLSGSYLDLYEEDTDLMEDIELANEQLIESCKSNLKTIQNIRSAYSAIITNSLNQVIKFLTALTIILTLPTVIASLYGMNVALPLGDHPSAFWFIIGGTLAAMGIAVLIFAKRDWI